MKYFRKLFYLLLVGLVCFIGYQIYLVLTISRSPNYEVVILQNNPYSSLFKSEVKFQVSVFYRFKADTVSQYVLNDSVSITIVKNANIPKVCSLGVIFLSDKQLSPRNYGVYTDMSIGSNTIWVSPYVGKEGKIKMVLDKKCIINTSAKKNSWGIITDYTGSFSLMRDDKTLFYYSPMNEHSKATVTFISKNGTCYLLLITQSGCDNRSYLEELFIHI